MVGRLFHAFYTSTLEQEVVIDRHNLLVHLDVLEGCRYVVVVVEGVVVVVAEEGTPCADSCQEAFERAK